jgi:transposase
MSKKRRNYTREFKQEALELWRSSGKSAQQIEEDLGISHGLLYKWQGDVQRAGEAAFPGHGQVSASEAEVRQLQRELAVVREERDILKKAVAIFAHPKA